MTGTWSRIETHDALTDLIGVPKPSTAAKVRPRLHHYDRVWLAASPFVLIGTADATGRCDVSPKGDPAGGLVHVLDDTTIALAERPGNKRVDGYRNVLDNPFVGLNFFIPGRGDTLRINGRASLVDDADFFDDLVVKGHRPLLCLVVEIEEIFHHCAKAFLRSRLWEPQTWDPTVLPSVAALTKAVRPEVPESLEELERYYGPSYEAGLYRES